VGNRIGGALKITNFYSNEVSKVTITKAIFQSIKIKIDKIFMIKFAKYFIFAIKNPNNYIS
jgi:hypothetical protein